MAFVVDLTGKKFGRLTAVRLVDASIRHGVWECVCDCGRTHITRGHNLRFGATKSCGCLQREAAARNGKATSVTNRTHGRTDTPEYRSWRSMLTRTCNKASPAYIGYGGRGITVCSRWRESFEAFFADMGERPSLKHTLERIKNDRGYWCGRSDCKDCGPLQREPNCIWATKKQQNRNKRSCVILTFGGESLTLAEWSERTGICHSTLSSRIRAKWDVERILTTSPLHPPTRPKKVIA